MSNWFDEDKNNIPENNGTTGMDSFSGNDTSDKPETPPAADPAFSADVNSTNANPVSGGWYTNPASAPASANPYNTQSNAQSGTPSSGETGGAAPSSPYTTTYHYGTNTPNPVPNGSNDYRSQAPYSGGYPTQNSSYQPQGSYDPYGWRTPVQPGQSGQQSGIHPQSSPKPPKKKMSGTKIAITTLSIICAAAVITTSVLLYTVLSGNGLKQNADDTSNTTSASSTAGDTSSPSLKIESDTGDSSALTTPSIIAKNLNSTVVITTYEDMSGNAFYNNGSDGLTEAGTATGIIMQSDGYIITNWHVVVNENTGNPYARVDVETHDGKTYTGAQVLGADQSTDLAVIKINATGLTAATFGDSSKLQLGDKVITIGNAGGLNWTTTQGIVSGLARDVYDDTGYSIKCLQIDAAINPGNSGGPLLNGQGEVVGINSAKIVAQGYEGIGFSIPINEAQPIIDDLIKYGYVKGRVELGISGTTITQIGYQGFRIQAINSGSCLSGTQAQVGDIITGVNGTTVTDYSTLRTELAKHKVGDTITLTLIRVDSRTGAKTTFTVKCTLKESKS